MKYQKIKITEETIRKELNNRNHKYINTYHTLITYLQIYDIIHSSNHANILKSIYESNNIYQNIISKTFINNISERTLYQYRKQYIIYFTKIYSMDTTILFSNAKEFAI